MQIKPATQRSIIGYRGARKTVLVVDDEPIHRGLVAEILAAVGVHTHEAQTAEECLSFLAAAEPDLFILDVNMAAMDGLELARVIRQQGIKKPILMLSADATEAHKPLDQLASHDDYMTKPFRNQVFLEKIGSMLNLDWVYAPQAERDEPAGPELHPGDLGAAIEHPLLQQLLENALIGHKKGFMLILQEISAQAILEPRQVQQIKTLADAMQFSRLAQILGNDKDELP